MKAEQINQLKKKYKKNKNRPNSIQLTNKKRYGVNQIQNCTSNKRKVITISEVPNQRKTAVITV